MPAIVTVFDERGEVKTSTSSSFHFVGEKANLAVEVQVAENSVVEVPLAEIFAALLER